MDSNKIRQEFLDFFRGKAHEIVPSSPVVPFDDPTLMFTNAGMNQFKDVFLGTGSRPYKRAADTQKCIRAGGKHNDLDDVGQDTYHHTFFEMLGNWSFGDYFKKEAIEWAWELLTKIWGIDKSRLHATYFEGNAAEGVEADNEARDLWAKVAGMPPSHIHPGNKKDNFWEMGDSGPCGPCSEIHIDLTPDKSGAALVNKGDHRVMEIWNLVFIQFNRGADGKLTPLPAKHVDTGMGFERLCAVLQGTRENRIGQVSNYDTGVFTPLFEAIQRRTGAPTYKRTLPVKDSVRGGDQNSKFKIQKGHEGSIDPSPHHHITTSPPQSIIDNRQSQIMVDVSYRVIADHIRCLTFALTDGAIPSNEGRGYVLRRILRRAVRYGRQYMNMHEPFLCDLVAPLVEHMSGAFPELRTAHRGKNVEHVTALIRDEEASFLQTLDRGIQHFHDAVVGAIATQYAKRKGLTAKGTSFGRETDELLPRGWCFYFDSPQGTDSLHIGELTKSSIAESVAFHVVIPGRDLFKLHDTYGFPIDLTQLMANELGLGVDITEYERLMEEARAKARAVHEVREMIFADDLADYSTQFEGFETLRVENTAVQGILRERNFLLELPSGDKAALILFHTPFYAEQGGQVGDVGLIQGANGSWDFEVTDTKKIGSTYLHYGVCRRGTVKRIPAAQTSMGKPPGPVSANESKRKADSYVIAQVSTEHRCRTMQNHTATHVLNWALREVLEIEGGGKVDQKGSLVDPEKTRFDFSHNKPLSDAELDRIEKLCGEQIAAKLPVYAASREEDFQDQKQAREINTLRAVFGEKYPDKVRVVSIGAPVEDLLRDPKNPKWMKYSVEFCGGTHVKNTGEIEHFVLIHEEGVAKGVRRVVGISGQAARDAEALGARLLDEARQQGNKAARQEGVDAAWMGKFQKRLGEAIVPIRVRRQIQDALLDVQKALKEQAKESAAASGDAALDAVKRLFESAQTVGGVTMVVGEVPPASPDALRGAIDWVRNKAESSAVLLGFASEGKVTLVAGMSKTAVDRGLKAGDLIKEICPLVGGKGGGRPDMAQGGGTDTSGLPNALDRAGQWIESRLK